ncbi:hypothetical protein GCK72_020665 [Caenorhabditis remanei]|uniref:Receptor L-domain domain-containing protein n=1 Tax=Caenorhabditis remanei TaxID=31234 RepID=A0A6A5GFW5_CAERE|nr:hypothetical protein GCK72_020665 [Caenorhabditis remanei]KAF1754107.1 hypothetical protein GCK72_020665 [Caenorhabditis remanei]
MSTLVGGLRMENSNLSSLSFLTPDKNNEFRLGCQPNGFIIENNSQLTDIGGLQNMRPLMFESLNMCKFRIVNNPKLDLESLCWSYQLIDLVNLTTEGNLKNCGCQGDQINASSLSNYQSCTRFYNGLVLHNITKTTDLSPLSNVQTVLGKLEIRNSNIQNLSFLTNLKYFKVYAESEIIFNLKDNPEMTRLGLSALEEFENVNYETYPFQTGNIENLHPDFCLTEDEFNFFDSFHFINLHAKACEFDEQGLCYFESMDKLPNNCLTIIGNLVIESGDEEHINKLIRVYTLFGTLIIRNTQLVDFSFLPKLTLIISLNDTLPVVQILSNKNLTNPKIGSSVRVM